MLFLCVIEVVNCFVFFVVICGFVWLFAVKCGCVRLCVIVVCCCLSVFVCCCVFFGVCVYVYSYVMLCLCVD